MHSKNMSPPAEGAASASITALDRLAYGIGDAAAALDLSRSRLYELIASGEIAVCKIGKRTIIPAVELTAFLDRHRVARPTGRFPAAKRASTRVDGGGA